MKALTYLIYIIAWETLTVGGGAYVVFGLNRSAWWMLAALIFSAGAYTPAKWSALYDKAAGSGGDSQNESSSAAALGRKGVS
jgi:hypothetical protein